MSSSAPINIFSMPCSLVSSLVVTALAVIFWSSYGMGVTVRDRGQPAYLSSTWWMSVGCCLAALAIAILKFVE